MPEFLHFTPAMPPGNLLSLTGSRLQRNRAFPERFPVGGNQFHLPTVPGEAGEQTDTSGGRAVGYPAEFSGAPENVTGGFCRFGIGIDENRFSGAMKHRFPDQFIYEVIQCFLPVEYQCCDHTSGIGYDRAVRSLAGWQETFASDRRQYQKHQ